MSGFQPANESSPRDGEFRPLLDPSADPPSEQEAGEPTAFQRELSEALAEGEHSTHVNDRPETPGSVFWDVALGAVGITSLLAGIVLVFFFAAAGAIVLMLGALLSVMAFTGTTGAGEPRRPSRSP